jgi:hypothetical protein
VPELGSSVEDCHALLRDAGYLPVHVQERRKEIICVFGRSK